ncbi:MAG: hypothetical protein IID53_06625 [Proteobacteria bacterium]|nr:hypothetical protein [Pseudomonadota bacterium]
MAQTRQQIEAFVRRLVVEVEAAEAAGMTAPQAIADHFNATGVTTRKGRRWTGATVAKFLSSPGARRTRSGGQGGAGGQSGAGGNAGRVGKRGAR